MSTTASTTSTTNRALAQALRNAGLSASNADWREAKDLARQYPLAAASAPSAIVELLLADRACAAARAAERDARANYNAALAAYRAA